ncbi:hypothetical protein PMZ80_007107 [Knufia obscura]|uniref:VOC domain-containing protein n=1 Tax=Knufia obscura TaxID=1635080 RepID=A0ABR0RJ88_9EURO|nr:hypothetical protein PMZ80_007107 [Knufia obscura]
MPSSITLTVKSLAQSTSFFLSALQPIDYVYRGRVENTIGFGLKDSPPDFWISQETPGIGAGAAHVAFPATSRQNVQDFFVAALKAGGKCHGEPLLRDPATGYYSAAVIDFDGNSIEAVYRPDLIDEGYGSRPSSVSSVSSVKAPSTNSKASTTVSKASTARQTPTEVRSVAPSHASKASSRAPTQISRVPSSTSKAQTSVSRSPTQVSRAPTTAPSQVSRAPSHASRAPTSISRAQTHHSSAPSQPQPQQQITQHTTPTGEVVTTIVSQAQGALSIAKELVNHVRPALNSANSAPNTHSTSSPSATVSNAADANSHKPSDTIVGTLLGVAAGAALHYAYTKVSETSSKHDAEIVAAKREAAAAAAAGGNTNAAGFRAGYGSGYKPPIARTNTEPSYAGVDDRRYYYHEYRSSPVNQPYAIEAPNSEYSRYEYEYEPSRTGAGGRESQRYITMQDSDETLSEIAPSTVRPRRRRSFDGVEVRSFANGSGVSQGQSRASQNPGSRSRMLEAPPTSYRAPTAITMVGNATEAGTDVSGRGRGRSRSRARGESKSRVGSAMRSMSVSGGSKARSSRHGHGSDEDLNVETRSKADTRTSRRTSRSRAPSIAPSERSDARTVVPIKSVAPSAAPSKSKTQTSCAPSRAPSTSTSTVRPENKPLPPSRAGTTVSAAPAGSEYHSTHSKANKTVIGRMLEKDRAGGSALTKSVVGKLAESDKLNVSEREVDPSDSVSQVSSVRSRRSSRR